MHISKGANPETVDQMYNKIILSSLYILIEAILESEKQFRSCVYNKIILLAHFSINLGK
jgi:hypothetical protein